MLTLIAAKKTASVIVFMMIDLLALFVSRPALFFCRLRPRERYRLGANLQLEMHQAAHRQFQKSGSRTFSITNADHQTASCPQANRASAQLRRAASVRHSRRAVRRRSVIGRQARGAQERIAAQFVKSATTPTTRRPRGLPQSQANTGSGSTSHWKIPTQTL